MSNWSFWEKSRYFDGIQDLIVGGGLVGMSTAYHLKLLFPQRRVVVIDRDPFSAGASTKNAGFACFGSPSELLSDLKHSSEGEVLALVERRFKGLNYLREILGDDQIGYVPCGGTELFREEDGFLEKNCIEKLDYLNSLLETSIGKEVYQLSNDHLFFSGKKKFVSSIKNKLEGSIDTGRMVKAFKEKCMSIGVEFFNGINITSVNENGSSVLVDDTEILAERIFICVNAFAKNLIHDLEVRPARNQVVVTNRLLRPIPLGTYHLDEGYIYFRSIDDRILIGGFRNTAMEEESTQVFGLTDLIQNKISSFITNYITDEEIKIDYRWSGILGLGDVKKPIVTKINDSLFVGVRMGGMGVAIGSLVGKELSELAR
jgi:glycine/D-amino acid oxidase-like deaminating enzyme